MLCLNFCEVLQKEHFENGCIDTIINGIEKEKECKINRLYAGSSFCSQYFITTSFWDLLFQLCEKNGYKVTLTIPVFSEKNLEKGKKTIDYIIRKLFPFVDEVTINDFGMLDFITNYEIGINFGRLFFKDPRDIRVNDYFSVTTKPAALSFGLNSYATGVELDPICKEIDLSSLNSQEQITIGLHTPFCYLTTGNICKYASVHKKIEKKFRPNIECQLECSRVSEVYFGDSNGNTKYRILRFGRTVYFQNSEVNVIGEKPDRIIYAPMQELIMRQTESEGD